MLTLKKSKSDEKKLYDEIKNNDVERVKSIIAKANEKNKILKLKYLLNLAIENNNIEIVKLLFEYANSHNIFLDLDEKDNNGKYPLLYAIFNNNIDIIKLIIEFSDSYYPLDLYEKDNKGNFPLLSAIKNNNIEIVKILFEYANSHNYPLKLNDHDYNRDYSLLHAISNNNINMVKLIIEFANSNNFPLCLNEQNVKREYPLLLAINNNNIEIVKILIEFSYSHNYLLSLNDQDIKGNFPLLSAVRNNNINIVKLLINYANINFITLKLNQTDKKQENPIYNAVIKKNIEMAKLLIKYAENHDITLYLNEETNGEYFIKHVYDTYDDEMLKLFIEYAKRYFIGLNCTSSINDSLWKDYQKNREMYGYSSFTSMGRVKNESYGEEEKIKREKIEKERIVNVESEYRKTEKEMVENNRERIKIEKNGMRIIVKKKERMEIDKSVVNKNDINKNEIKQNKNDLQPKTPTLVIAVNTFSGEKYDQLDITKNEFLMVTNWNCEDGWIYGYRKDNKEEKGLFPKVFIKIYKEENKGKRTYNDIYFNSITPEYRIQFENKIKRLRLLNEMKVIDDHTDILINRKSVFNDAFNIVMFTSPEELKKRLVIKYIGENGIDVGGLLRDFFYQISKVIGNLDYSLFKYPHNNSYELEINPNSNIEPNHLLYFNFIGRVIGLAIFHKHYLSVSFTLLLLKKLLNKPLDINDLEYVDPEMFKSLKQLKENDGAENSYLTFEMDTEDCFGNRTTIELKPNGANINVTDSNKNEYIDLIVKNKLNNTNDKEQLNALKKGFYDIIPKSINTILDELDLKYLISGINEIDVDDWENNTDYDGYQADDITIKNFWKCVRNFSNENRTQLLIFATGNSQVPVTGFKDLQGSGRIQHFKIKKYGTVNDLPSSHTCFNRIDLPPYTSYTQMKQKLLLSISEGVGAFDID